MFGLIKQARVIAAHPESNAVDVIILEDGRRLNGVRCISLSASSDTGMADLPQPQLGPGTDPMSAPIGPREMVALIAFLSGLPVCLGFLFPNVSQLMFADGRMVYRHGSDFYNTIDSQGNAESRHPSGAYMRVGSSPAHEDLTGKDIDGKWAITKNTGALPYIHFEIPGKVSVDMAPSGALTVVASGDVAVTAGGAATIHSVGDMTLSSDTHLTLSAPRIDFN